MDKPLSVMALQMVLRRMNADGVTVHGFRSAFRDWAAECTNCPNEVCEAALAHGIKNKAEAAYRRGDLFDKRRKLMEAWANYCAGPRIGRVVAFRQKAEAISLG
jgi:integrase